MSSVHEGKKRYGVRMCGLCCAIQSEVGNWHTRRCHTPFHPDQEHSWKLWRDLKQEWCVHLRFVLFALKAKRYHSLFRTTVPRTCWLLAEENECSYPIKSSTSFTATPTVTGIKLNTIVLIERYLARIAWEIQDKNYGCFSLFPL